MLRLPPEVFGALSRELGALKREAIFYPKRAATAKLIARQELEHADAILLTEGKTDSKHLTAAMRSLSIRQNIFFFEDDQDRGADALLTICEHYSLMPPARPLICVFDRDRDDITKTLLAKDPTGLGYQDWGNNV